MTVRTPRGLSDARALITQAQFALTGMRPGATMADVRAGTTGVRPMTPAQAEMVEHLEAVRSDLDSPEVLPRTWRRQLRFKLELAAQLATEGA